MASNRCPGLLLAACLAGAPGPASATLVAMTQFGFNNLMITPAAGPVVFDGDWTREAFARSDNSLGLNDVQFATGTAPGTQSATAAVMWASAQATASATNPPSGLSASGSVQSGINIPGHSEAAAFGKGRSSLFNSFTLGGAGASQALAFSVNIFGMFDLLTDAGADFASSDLNFDLSVDGVSILNYHRLEQIGVSDALADAFTQNLLGSVTLDTFDASGGLLSHFLSIDLESDPSGKTVPEPAAGWLVGACLAALATARHNRRRNGYPSLRVGLRAGLRGLRPSPALPGQPQ